MLGAATKSYSSWDYPISIFQPILAYLFAPWSTAVFYKQATKKATAVELYVATCLMLFTGSWSIELYILMRDGAYMHDWIPNILIGIVCYLFVGLLWNVEWKQKQGTCKFWLEP